MKVLLTGASGFLGKVLINKLSNAYDLNTLGRNCDANVICDLSKEVPGISNHYDGIIHCAGKAHLIPKTKKEEQEFLQVNYQGTINLITGLNQLKAKPKFFIFISTVSVYGVDQGQNISEDYPLNGNSPYAKSKILAEKYLQNWASANNVILGILRLPLIAAPNPPGNLGAMIKGIRTGRYFGIGNLNARKSIVWAEDVANLIPKVAELGGIYNLTDGHHPTFKEIEDCIAKALHKESPPHIPLSIAKAIALLGNLLGKYSPINFSILKKMTSTLTFDDSKARQMLNWKPSAVLQKLHQVI